jgi:hypothetical protein
MTYHQSMEGHKEETSNEILFVFFLNKYKSEHAIQQLAFPFAWCFRELKLLDCQHVKGKVMSVSEHVKYISEILRKSRSL